MSHPSKPVLSDWHRAMAAGIAAAHPITPAVPVRARGVHLAADNDEPEPDLGPVVRSESKAERFHRLNDRRALLLQVRDMDCGVL
mgnify:CR=1 FL=1